MIDPDDGLCTSLRGAGGCRAQFASDVNIALSLRSIEELKQFADEIEFRQNGYLLFTADAERAVKMRHLAEYQRERGVPIEEVSPSDLKSRVPCLNIGDVVYAQLGTADGIMEGPAVREFYRRKSRELGVQEVFAKATAVAEGAVSTEDQDIPAESVVVSTGHWSGFLGLPVRPEKHQLFFATPPAVDPAWPFTIDADTTFHFRPYKDGILICYNDPVLADAERGAYDPPDFEPSVLERLQPIADHRAPGLITPGNSRPGRAGFYAVTPDRHPILGRKDGVIIATGFGGHGVMHSPAAGTLVAEMVLDGEASTVDVSSLSPDRFERGELVVETMVF